MSGNINAYLFKLRNTLDDVYKRKRDEIYAGLRGQEEPQSSVLKLKSVEFSTADCVQHNTHKYESTTGPNPAPVLRRGQPFFVNLVFDRPFQNGFDLIHMILEYGPSPSFTNGTQFKIPVLDHATNKPKEWAIMLTDLTESTIRVKVSSPANSLVGRWKFKIQISHKTLKDTKEYKKDANYFYLLFNPWCKEDEVYVDRESWREAYVMRDYGVIYKGTPDNQSACSWVYGQFDFAVLSAIILLLGRSKLPYHQRGSAVAVARAVTALINSNDENGLLFGKWGTDFKNGINPEDWTGSTAIFDQYIHTNGTPVKYGQCWVFAGCLTTACRALGIACRPVTCYNSAHDYNETLTIDRYFDANHNRISKPGEIDDSIWNYHCWNEIWISRPDLPAEYSGSGWQAIDATPQEKSMGIYVCGPSPVKAIREGDLGMNYDVVFVFSEVNADILDLKKDNRSPWGWTVVDYKTNYVGLFIATLGISGQGHLEDITHSYKYTEGSKKEREVFSRALKQMPNAQKFYDNFYKDFDDANPVEDVEMTLEKIKSVLYGQSFQLVLTVKNGSDHRRTVQVEMEVYAVLYTGQVVALVKEGKTSFVLNPKETKCARLPVSEADYMRMNYSSYMKMATKCTVVETKQGYSNEEIFEITRQQLTMEIPSTMKLNREFNFKVSFRNPLAKELTNCILIVEGTGMLRPIRFNIPNVPIGGEVKKGFNILTKRLGECFISVMFTSDQIRHASGNGTVLVIE